MRKVLIVTRRRRASPPCRSTRNRFQLESLEPRRLLATYTVTNTNDTGANSLRSAITQVDLDSTPDVIDFDIQHRAVHNRTGSFSAQITNPVLIDGTSEPNYAGQPLIRIDGSSLTSSDWIFWDTAGSSTLQGLAIVGCPGAGVVLTTAGNNLIQSCEIGTPDGSTAKPNGVGIEIFGSNGNTIGGSVSSARNIISANTSEGIAIGDAQATEDNLIEGNYMESIPPAASGWATASMVCYWITRPSIRSVAT